MNGNPSDDGGGPSPSLARVLADRIGHVRAAVTPRPEPEWRATLAILLAAAILAAIVTGGGAWVTHRRIAERIAMLSIRAAMADRARAGLAIHAGAYATPDLESVVQSLAAHLPADVRLLSATLREGGLRIVIRTADPDMLRGRLRTDPWFAQFAERGQAVSADGGIDMMFERRS